MQQMQKQRQRTKRAVEEVELSVPSESLSDTSDAAELLARLDEILEV
jgi:hypothetical protein